MIKKSPSEKMSHLRVDVTAMSVVRVVVVFLGAYLAYKLNSILSMVFVSIVIAAVMDPCADWFERRHIPRWISMLVVYTLVFALFGLVAVLLIPPMIQELFELARNSGDLWNRLGETILNVKEFSISHGVEENIGQAIQSLSIWFSSAVTGALGTIGNIFDGIFTALVVTILSFYIVIEHRAAQNFFRDTTPTKYHPYLGDLYKRIQEKIGAWMRGQLLLMAIVGVLAYVGLLILGVQYALLLGLFAALTEIIPYVGPVISVIPAAIIAFTQSPIHALLVVILYIVIQQVESQIIVPKVMQRAVGLNPITSIIALLVGGSLGGVVGAILAIPVITAMSLVLSDYLRHRAEGVV